ncbi:MAG: pentapeptide repeat-containing protein [Gammaproteobacteria bacterium]|nr:pentapeptide repeat-containing protein [Gammaproteobacteria bacterium]
MKNSHFKSLFLGVVSVVISIYASSVFAWADKFDVVELNTLCEFKPESQCSWARKMGAQLAGVDMHNSSMASIRFDGANLQGANLKDSNMHISNLSKANLMLANLEGVHLHASNLHGANLTMANLRNANLLDADLTDANLLGANLQGAILISARLDNATWTDGRICAVGSRGECK